MASGTSLSRDQAARLLGVAPDAGAAEIRRAFRLWAVWAHPDHGGSAERFAALRAARDRLLEPVSVPGSRPSRGRSRGQRGDDCGSPDAHPTIPLRPRKPWAEVLAIPAPARVALLFAGALFSVVAMLVGVSVELPWGVIPAAVASALWCVALSRAILHGPDHGHVIVTRTVGWTAITVGQFGVAMLAAIPVVEVLPLLAVPFVAAIAAVNPAAGLWRGVSR